MTTAVASKLADALSDVRSLPSDTEAERAILGAVLLIPSAIDDAVRLLVPEMFFSDANRLIFESMLTLHCKNIPIEAATVRSELRQRDALERAGGAAYVSSLIDGLPAAANVQHYADIIKEKARLRAIANAANAVLSSAMNGANDLDQRLVQLAVSAKTETERSADFERLEEGRYRLTDPRFGIELEVDHLRRERGQLHGELTVWCSLPGARTTDGLLSSGSFNLSSQQVRGSQGKYLASRARTGNELDWTGLLEEFCHQVLTTEREGEPAVLLRDLPRPVPEEDFEVGGLRLLAHHPVVLFGDGGSAKSYIALHVAGVLAQRGLRVGLFDWELCGEDHRDRLERLFGTDMPDVRYLRCSQPLCHMVDAVRRMGVDHELDYLIFDSLAFACDGPPEAAEVAGRYFQALRKLGPIGSLHIAHVSKAEGADRNPFGSTFWSNGARSTWFAKLAESGPRRESHHGGALQPQGEPRGSMPGCGLRDRLRAGAHDGPPG